MQKSMRLVTLLFLVSISIFITLFFIWQYASKTAAARHGIEAQAISTTEKTEHQISRFITSLVTETDKISALLADNNDRSTLEQILKAKPAFITGLAVLSLNSTNTMATGSYYVEKNGQEVLISLADAAAVADVLPFLEAIKNNPNGYAGPLIDPYTGEKVLVYVRIQKDTKNGPRFIVATQSLNHMQHVLNTLSVGKQGYWFIADARGQIIIHPRTSFTERSTFLYDFAKITGTSAVAHMNASEKGTLIYNNEITHQSSWLIHQKLSATNWILCGVFEQRQAALPNSQQRHYLMIITIGMLISFLLLMFLVAFIVGTVRAHHWILAIMASCACTAAITSLWSIAKKYPSYTNYDEAHSITPIENKVELYQFLDALKSSTNTLGGAFKDTLDDPKLDYYLTYRYKQGRYIPTGTFIHYMHFISDSQVQIVGYVWQRYFDGTHDGIARGFVLPQATADASITEVFHTKIERQETIIWRINATLNQNFSYTRYPFDTREISIQLWHADFGQNIILVPDLDSYPLLTTTSLPGLSANAYIPNWQFTSSYFGYQKYLYNSLFGLYTYGPFGIYDLFNKSETPELHFVATARRLLTDTFIDDLLPLFLIALLLFVVFLTDIGHGYPVFAAYASIFFGIVVAQLHFRGKIPTNQLVYFEMIYVIMYLALIVTLMFTLLKFQNPDPNSPEAKQGNIAEILYWPALLSSIIVLTVFYLY
ncbi:MAG: cache domain-containing protein [Epsilonproteobacteria bacterium]|nr:cache domain-containing protein [Campylobacterota bacterium]